MEKKGTQEKEHTTVTHPGAVRLVSVDVIDRVADHAEVLMGPEDSARLLSQLIGNKDREHFVTLHLDTRHRVIAAETVSIGTLNQSLVHAREVFKAAILNNAQAIICGHNHPSGDITPSREDRSVAERLKDAGELLGIPLVDFIIVSGTRSWALSESP